MVDFFCNLDKKHWNSCISILYIANLFASLLNIQLNVKNFYFRSQVVLVLHRLAILAIVAEAILDFAESFAGGWLCCHQLN